MEHRSNSQHLEQLVVRTVAFVIATWHDHSTFGGSNLAILKDEDKPMFMHDLLDEPCGRVVLWPMSLVQSAFSRMFHYSEISADVG
jgi:hypothetical protein